MIRVSPLLSDHRLLSVPCFGATYANVFVYKNYIY